ncbi:unnamed protein product [Ilex paraguariensis]|uniref:Trichome birefringence-like N-terminal domain-containing protein n=1 Tax=Ilex paraguariensis TaxID=185542 RepID=A0ABC8SVH7_9AQUA
MTSASHKESTMAYPRTLISIIASVGGLAVFLIIASSFLVSQPIGSAVRGYFYGVNHSKQVDLESWVNQSVIDSWTSGFDSQHDVSVSGDSGKSGSHTSKSSDSGVNTRHNGSGDVTNKDRHSKSRDKNDLSNSQHGEKGPPIVSKTKDVVHQPAPLSAMSSNSTNEGKATKSHISSNVADTIENVKPSLPDILGSVSVQTDLNDTIPTSQTYVASVPSLSPAASNVSKFGSGCDLYDGKWVHDSTGPLYRNDSCPVLTQMQNCQGNGRPDKDYENWRWKPSLCDLPRFDANKFLELMRGKTLAFIGDSVARNQMESMLCILWQVEEPKNRGNRRMQRYYFKSTNTMIIRIWSSWLVHQTDESFDFSPAGVVKLHLDAPDEGFMDFIPTFDVVVLSSGHWFAKQSVYILNNEIVGGQLWWPDKSRQKKIDNVEAFGISVETILTAMVTHPNYTGLTIVRSYSPDHYEGGAWNTGGSCTGQIRPALDGELVENGFTNIMHEKQVMGFKRAINKKANKSTLRLMDITKAFGYRHDGHPGPYRSPDPNKITKRGPDGRPPPQDCLHWCMPGPVDTWNELVLEIIRREFQGSQKFPS